MIKRIKIVSHHRKGVHVLTIDNGSHYFVMSIFGVFFQFASSWNLRSLYLTERELPHIEHELAFGEYCFLHSLHNFVHLLIPFIPWLAKLNVWTHIILAKLQTLLSSDTIVPP